jgi:hypothetical protein
VVQQKKGVAVKTKISWRNKKGRRGENKNIVAQQKKGISVKTKISWQFKRFSPPF